MCHLSGLVIMARNGHINLSHLFRTVSAFFVSCLISRHEFVMVFMKNMNWFSNRVRPWIFFRDSFNDDEIFGKAGQQWNCNSINTVSTYFTELTYIISFRCFLAIIYMSTYVTLPVLQRVSSWYLRSTVHLFHWTTISTRLLVY